MRFKTGFHAALLACAMLTLNGCETMEQTMATVKQKVSSIEMPSFATKDDATAPVEPGAEMAAVSNKVMSAPGCPPIEVLPELNVMHQFIDANSRRAEDMLSTLKMSGFTSQCKRNESNIIVDLDIRFEGTLGPKAHAWNTDHPSFAYPYFIAVTTPNGNIMAKEVFGVTVSYSSGQNSIIHEEHIRQIIPAMGEMGGGTELLMGFQLTEAELAFNRSMMAGMPLAGGSEALLTGGNPALVYEGDPALEPAKKAAAPKKKKKKASPPKPESKPGTATAPPAAPEPVPAPTAAEPAPAPVMEIPPPAGEPAPAATTPGEPVPPPAATEADDAPPAVEMLDDGFGSMEPPPYNPPSDITAPPQ